MPQRGLAGSVSRREGNRIKCHRARLARRPVRPREPLGPLPDGRSRAAAPPRRCWGLGSTRSATASSGNACSLNRAYGHRTDPPTPACFHGWHKEAGGRAVWKILSVEAQNPLAQGRRPCRPRPVIIAPVAEFLMVSRHNKSKQNALFYLPLHFVEALGRSGSAAPPAMGRSRAIAIADPA